MFFFEKKNQKTFAPLRVRVPPAGVTSKNQSFFASFCSQKEVLASLAILFADQRSGFGTDFGKVGLGDPAFWFGVAGAPVE
jgi:hypothetical protein